MYADADLRVLSAVTVAASTPDYSSFIDLTKSPDVGSGGELAFIVTVDAYTAHGSPGNTTIDAIYDTDGDGSGTIVVCGSIELTPTQLEARDDWTATTDHGRQAIVIRINPMHDIVSKDIAGVAQRYLGLRFTHATNIPTVFTATAHLSLNWQSDPKLAHGDSGMTIA